MSAAETPLFQIAHLSDVHFGRIEHPGIVGALVEEINASAAGLVVVSGDLTQRARKRQFRAAAAMLEAFEPPVLVVPGNHDVYPWWRPLSRLVRPLDRFRRYIRDDLHPSFEAAGVAVMGLNSAIGHTVKGGRITKGQLRRLRAFFAAQPEPVFKVLAVHHHLSQLSAIGPHDVARNARRALEAASEAGVDLLLCGHLHVSHVEPVMVVPANHRIVIASAGTATSNRGRGLHSGVNFYNRICVFRQSFTIDERKFDPEQGCFTDAGLARFARLP